jgi:iron complex outermembrane receptor protein
VSPPGCSSFTPQGRYIFGPNFAGGASITLDDGVLNDGMSNIPQFDPNNPDSLDYHAFTNADRFNFNGPGFNYLRTPNERINLFTNVTYDFTESLRFIGQALYNNRTSDTRGAPEPLCLGNGCGNQIATNTIIHEDNPFNPFGATLSTADGTLEFFGRRPLESGSRRFEQDIDTYFFSGGVEGEFSIGSRDFYWDATASYGDNDGFQEKRGSHNQANLAVALGDPTVCAQVPGCVPFNFFGGQGPDGSGSITQEMLDFVGFVQRDRSEQQFKNYSANVSGDIMELPAGDLGFATGVEYRDVDGSFSPDLVAASGQTAGIPSGPTSGSFDVTEWYGEVNVPIAADLTGIDYLEVNGAIRYSDYDTVDSETTYMVNALYRPISSLSIRGSYNTGFRAPGIGELFGGAAREDFTYSDPCNDYLALAGSGAGGRDTPQSAEVIANCQALLIPDTFVQLNPQVSAVSRGNEALEPEESDNWGIGVVYGPEWVENVSWIESLTLSLDYYNIEIDDAIQGLNPGDVANACTATLESFFCDNVDRSPGGTINLVDNQLQNIGNIDTSGLDFSLRYATPETGIGQFFLEINATYLDEYKEELKSPDGSSTETDFQGTITDETFQRAFPEWRSTTRVDWLYERWSASLTFRYVDELEEFSGGAPAGSDLDSVFFTDLQVNYTLPIDDNEFRFTIGSNNVLDEDPETCRNSCGIIGMSPVAHDLPGRTIYVRASYRR